jgi:hypothetical protein
MEPSPDANRLLLKPIEVPAAANRHEAGRSSRRRSVKEDVQMDAIGVAARPGFGRIRIVSAAGAVALALGLGVGMILAMGVLRPVAVPVTPNVPTTPEARMHAGVGGHTAASGLSSYRQLVENIAVAEASRDHRALIRFSGRLNAMLDAGTLGVVAAEHARLETALAAAWESGDNREAHAVQQQLDSLCGTKTVRAYLAFCK